MKTYYALNYRNPFIPLPLKEPMGKVRSGIALMSRFSAESVVRRQLPGNYSWPLRIFYLKRCAIISRMPSSVEGKDWYIINIHLTAYGGRGNPNQAACLPEGFDYGTLQRGTLRSRRRRLELAVPGNRNGSLRKLHNRRREFILGSVDAGRMGPGKLAVVLRRECSYRAHTRAAV